MSDLINREELIELLEKEQEIYEKTGAIPSFWTALSVIEHAPTVEAKEVVHGEWTPFYEDVEVYNSGGFTIKSHTGYICSICGKGFTTHYTNFCPNCGADMKKKV